MYENIKAFIITTKVSKSKVYRFYKKNEELWSETKLNNGKRLFPTDHARYFDSEIMFDEKLVIFTMLLDKRSVRRWWMLI